MKEFGLYLPDDSFLSREEIMQKNATSGVEFVTPVEPDHSFDYWSQRMKDRQAEYLETALSRQEHIKFRFPHDSAIAFIGDPHIGSPYTDYARLEEEVKAVVSTPNCYLIFLGDVVDGFFFNPAEMEQMEQVPEQYQYMYALLHHLGKFTGENRKLLAGFAGDHDGWAKKMGLSAYHQFQAVTGAHYMEGVGYITATVGETDYKITAAHRLPGFSMYNNTHPQIRAGREIQGADIYVSAHTHRKGDSDQPMKEFGGTARSVNYISVGPYKATDEYGRKLGFARQATKELYGTAVVLREGEKKIEVYPDILEATRSVNERAR